MNFFECKVKYDKVMENGLQKSVSEPYLVDALSFTEAEARIIEEMTPFISGDFTVSNVRRMNLAEVFTDDNGGVWYKAKLVYFAMNEKSGAEKMKSLSVLVQASNIQEALAGITEGMGCSTLDYKVVSVSETQIMDLFVYGKH